MGLSDGKLLSKIVNLPETLNRRRERKLALRNRLEKEGFTRNGPKRVLEAFVAPPSFNLYLWAAFPLLMIATFEIRPIIAGVIALIINYILIHMDTFAIVRYLLAGLVTLVVFLLYHFSVI